MAVVACCRFILMPLLINLAVCSGCCRRQPTGRFRMAVLVYRIPTCLLKKSALRRVPRSPDFPITGQCRRSKKKRPGVEPAAARKAVASLRSHGVLYGTDTSEIRAAEGELLSPGILHESGYDVILWRRLDTRQRIGRNGPYSHATESLLNRKVLSSFICCCRVCLAIRRSLAIAPLARSGDHTPGRRWVPIAAATVSARLSPAGVPKDPGILRV